MATWYSNVYTVAGQEEILAEFRGAGTPHGLVPVDESDRHRVGLFWLTDAWHLPMPAFRAAKGESGRADDEGQMTLTRSSNA